MGNRLLTNKNMVSKFIVIHPDLLPMCIS